MEFREFKSVVRGFDVYMKLYEDSDNFDITLLEGGEEIYHLELPVSVDEDSDMYSSDFIDEAAKIAVDMFEASRGTLGQGAGATKMEANKMKKNSGSYYCGDVFWLERWFSKMKGTMLEQQAIDMYTRYLDMVNPENISAGLPDDSELIKIQNKIRHELSVMNFNRLRSSPANKVIVVMDGEVKEIKNIDDGEYDEMKYYINSFKNHPLEVQVLSKVKEYMEISKQLSDLHKFENDKFVEVSDLKKAMDEMILQLAYQDAEIRDPGNIMLEAPNMANDVMELMEGVDLNAPLTPMNEMYAKRIKAEGGEGIDFYIKHNDVYGEDRYNAIKEIIDQGNIGLINNTPIDLFSASMVIQIADALNEKNREKLLNFDMYKMLNTVYELFDKHNKSSRREFKKALLNADSLLINNNIFGSYANINGKLFKLNKKGNISRSLRKANFVHIPGDYQNQMFVWNKRSFEEVPNIDELVDELGVIHEGIDPAIVDEEEFKFKVNDKVKLKKETVIVIGGGVRQTFPSGAEGCVESLWDEHGDYCLFRDNDSGYVFKIKCEDLVSAK